jgi:hypothetical protein
MMGVALASYSIPWSSIFLDGGSSHHGTVGVMVAVGTRGVTVFVTVAVAGKRVVLGDAAGGRVVSDGSGASLSPLQAESINPARINMIHLENLVFSIPAPLQHLYVLYLHIRL